MKKLNMKAWELIISDGNAECGECHRTISSGRPALVHRTVSVEAGELVVNEKTEHVRLCSDPPPRSELSTEVRIERRKPPLPEIRREWEQLSDVALREHQAGFPIHNLAGERVANGYTSILTFNDNLAFLECSESQVVTTMFKEVPGESDRYGVWVHMETPSGFYARKYLTSDGNLLAGKWYFRLNLVKPSVAQARGA